jgi:hypothetical protein
MPLEMTKLTNLEGGDEYVVDAWITSVADPVGGESPRAGCKIFMSDGARFVKETKEQVMVLLGANVKG